MTMPHLMNCPHSEDGWCLACVNEMYEEHKRRHTKHKESEAMNQAELFAITQGDCSEVTK